MIVTDDVADSAHRNGAVHRFIADQRHRDQLEAINKFPNLNPNPVLRISFDGVLLYSNSASQPITSSLGLSNDEKLPDQLFENLMNEAGKEMASSFDIVAGTKTFSLLPVMFKDQGFINVYGTDVTAKKVLNKFPDLNPNPVMKMTGDGTLDYANNAADLVIKALGTSVDEKLIPEIIGSIEDVCNNVTDEPLLVNGSGRTFSLLPVYTPEFEITNIYGSDITARIAMNKFPDQN